MRNLYLNWPAMMLAFFLTPSVLGGGLLFAEAQTKTQTSPLTGQLVKTKTVKSTKYKVGQPKYHIDFTAAQANKSTKPFQTIQASLPDKAIKVYLHRIKAEPNSFAGLLPNQGETNLSNSAASEVPSVSGKQSTTSDTGSQPRTMSASGVAIPQTTGATSSFFK